MQKINIFYAKKSRSEINKKVKIQKKVGSVNKKDKTVIKEIKIMN